LTSLYDTKVITEIIQYENLSEERFLTFIGLYTDIFKFIQKIDRLDKIKLTSFFHRISYYSLISIESLNQFWNEWKNKRDLKP